MEELCISRFRGKWVVHFPNGPYIPTPLFSSDSIKECRNYIRENEKMLCRQKKNIGEIAKGDYLD